MSYNLQLMFNRCLLNPTLIRHSGGLQNVSISPFAGKSSSVRKIERKVTDGDAVFKLILWILIFFFSSLHVRVFKSHASLRVVIE